MPPLTSKKILLSTLYFLEFFVIYSIMSIIHSQQNAVNVRHAANIWCSCTHDVLSEFNASRSVQNLSTSWGWMPHKLNACVAFCPDAIRNSFHSKAEMKYMWSVSTFIVPKQCCIHIRCARRVRAPPIGETRNLLVTWNTCLWTPIMARAPCALHTHPLSQISGYATVPKLWNGIPEWKMGTLLSWLRRRIMACKPFQIQNVWLINLKMSRVAFAGRLPIQRSQTK